MHILITSQTIRESWANTTEFNYSYFRKMHANQRKKYLNINYPAWRQFSSIPVTTSSSDNVTTRVASNRPPHWDEVNFSVKVVFLVGEPLSNETQLHIVQESDAFGDLIQESFVDSYNNLTLKTIMMLKWVTTNCGDRGERFSTCCIIYWILNVMFFYTQ